MQQVLHVRNENVDYLVLHSAVADEVCSMFYRSHQLIPKSLTQFLFSWKWRKNKGTNRSFWNRIHPCVMWVIWREQNIRRTQKL
uniref:Putative ovule protein n=1 Tax=Solanum chacoense TaxID=4108 RepID=A0A0V0H7A3_SOLCH